MKRFPCLYSRLKYSPRSIWKKLFTLPLWIFNFNWARKWLSREWRTKRTCASLGRKEIGRTVCSSDTDSWPSHPTGISSSPSIFLRPLMYILQCKTVLAILILNFKQVIFGKYHCEWYFKSVFLIMTWPKFRHIWKLWSENTSC